MAITTRETTATGVTNKGAPLTNAEVDTNFIELQQDKIELTDLSVTTNSAGTAALTYTNTTGVFTYTPPDLSSYLTSETNDLTASVTWANVPDANITESSVTQHEAALTVTSTQVSDFGEAVDDQVNTLLQAGLGIDLDYDDVSGELTIDSNHVEVNCTNNSGASIAIGTPVYQTGVSGNNITIAPADADDAAKMPAIGLTTATIANGASGTVVILGVVNGLDTSSFTAGDTVYVSTTAGALTTTAPSGESGLIQNFGRVLKVNASAGSIAVMGAGRANAVPNLNDGNVFIGNASNQAETRALVEADISDFGSYIGLTDLSVTTNAVGTAALSYNNTTGVFSYTPPDLSSYLTSYTETDPVVGAVSGIVKADGAGNISAAVAGTDYLASYTETDTLDSVTGRGATTSNAVTVGNLTSTGIDDNATSTALTITDSGIAATLTTASQPNVTSVGTLSSLSVTGDLTVDTDTLYVDSTNNRVGIGEDSNLDASLVVRGGNYATNQDGGILIQAGDSTGNHVRSGFKLKSTGAGVFRTAIDVASSVGGTITDGNTYEAISITPSGNVGIGIDAPTVNLHLKSSANTNIGLDDDNGTGSTHRIATTGPNGQNIVINVDNGGTGGSSLIFRVNGNTERMRLDSSGNLLVGKTSSGTSTEGVQLVPSGSIYGTRSANVAAVFNRTTSTGHVVHLRYNNSTVGAIAVTATNTSYNTSSDQRLKENIVDAPAGNIDDIRVRSFDWKDSGIHQTYGMVAQELVEVAPEAVSQGATDDDMWGVDYSKLVPMMIKEIQDLKAEVAALKGAN